MKNYIDISLVCRICLQASDVEMMISLFEKEEREPFCIYEKIEKCANIKITNEPDLPLRICGKCKVFLSFAFKFYTMCQNSHNYLNVHKQTRDDSDFENEMDNVEFTTVEREQISNLTKEERSENTEDGFIEEIEEYWLEDNEIIDLPNENDEVITSKSQTHSPKKNVTKKKLLLKTLDIKSDGAAIIRQNNAEILRKQLKKNQSHICEICGNKFTKKYALDSHMRRHNNEKRFECEICPRKFNYNFQLRRHIIQHSGARPYKCSYCQRTFTDHSTMRKHERLHRNERPYECDVCHKTFTYSSVLKVHKQVHTGEKPYSCGICDKRFSRSHHLRAHLETNMHSKDPKAKILLSHLGQQCDG